MKNPLNPCGEGTKVGGSQSRPESSPIWRLLAWTVLPEQESYKAAHPVLVMSDVPFLLKVGKYRSERGPRTRRPGFAIVVPAFANSGTLGSYFCSSVSSSLTGDDKH